MLENEALTARLRVALRSARAVAQAPLLCPELRLYLLNQDFSRAPLSADEQAAVLRRTAYWCFCWPAGQVLARLLLDHRELVRGRKVVDLGCGSGVVALAAAMAGASQVVACDHDDDALEATRINAGLNGVNVEVCREWPDALVADLVVLSDVLYDPHNVPLLGWCQERSRAILAADCRVLCLPQGVPGNWTNWGRFASSLAPDLDWNDEFHEVQVFSWGGVAPPPTVARL